MQFLSYPEKEITFVRIFKSASRSIIKAFFDKEECINGFRTDFTSFACVRNPIERFKSASSMFFELLRYKYNIDDFLTMLETNDFGDHKLLKIHMLPQSDEFYRLTEVDYIFRYENLQQEWSKMSSLIGVEQCPEIPHIGKRINEIELTNEQINRVKQIYQEDIKRYYNELV